ncbi:MAG: hypothetical protein K8T10_13015 [Candidatus Eremiobacteraeota bacterium]|nr:hypothetical protein [Candidatus Eremiobacteraeota bacterium]
MNEDRMPFIGKAEQKLDNTGRVTVPVAFQRKLKGSFFLCQGINVNCIWILPEENFLTVLNDMVRKIPIDDDEGQEMKAVFASSAVDRTLDKQNRFSLPPHLIKYAGINKKVKIVGNVDRGEIWAIEKWQQIEEKNIEKSRTKGKYGLLGLCQNDAHPGSS